jgi:hypothetical protein
MNLSKSPRSIRYHLPIMQAGTRTWRELSRCPTVWMQYWRRCNKPKPDCWMVGHAVVI